MIDKLVLVSRVDFDKWFFLPFIMALKTERMRQLDIQLHLIGPSSPLAERILNLELKYTETIGFVKRTNQSVPIADIFKEYGENSLFVADSVYDYLGFYCADVITSGCLLTCYNIGFKPIPRNLMFANTLEELEDNIYQVITNSEARSVLRAINQGKAEEYSLTDADKATLDSMVYL